jgi:hypothetical protein
VAALKPVSRRELVRKLNALGFEGPFPGGKHEWVRRGGLRVTIPNPHAGAIDPGFIRRLLKQLAFLLTNGSRRLHIPAASRDFCAGFPQPGVPKMTIVTDMRNCRGWFRTLGATS